MTRRDGSRQKWTLEPASMDEKRPKKLLTETDSENNFKQEEEEILRMKATKNQKEKNNETNFIFKKNIFCHFFLSLRFVV